jgi:hypothetical protein
LRVSDSYLIFNALRDLSFRSTPSKKEINRNPAKLNSAPAKRQSPQKWSTDTNRLLGGNEPFFLFSGNIMKREWPDNQEFEHQNQKKKHDDKPVAPFQCSLVLPFGPAGVCNTR